MVDPVGPQEHPRVQNQCLTKYVHYDPLMMSQKESPRNQGYGIYLTLAARQSSVDDQLQRRLNTRLYYIKSLRRVKT